jgi:Flp pilus assembly protein TadB
MEEQKKEQAKPMTAGKSNMHATILAVLGIIVLIIGVAIVAIKHMPFRGSGLGTVLIVIGFVLLLIGIIRFAYKPK